MGKLGHVYSYCYYFGCDVSLVGHKHNPKKKEGRRMKKKSGLEAVMEDALSLKSAHKRTKSAGHKSNKVTKPQQEIKKPKKDGY